MPIGIYKIINVVNNNFYIGSAVNLRRRKVRHFSELRRGMHNNPHLQAAWIKYGESAFVFVVVEELPDTTALLATEDKWLKEHVGQSNCYNIGTTATAPHLGMSGELSPTWGYKHTKAAKARIGAASKTRVQTEEERATRRETMKGHAVPTETRLKISAALSGVNNPWFGQKRPEHGAKVSRPVKAVSPDGKEQQYPSIQALREDLNLKPPTVNRALKSGKALKRGPYAGWVFVCLDAPVTT